MGRIETIIEDGMSLRKIEDVMSDGNDVARDILKGMIEGGRVRDVMRLDKLQIRGDKIQTLYEVCCQSREDKFYLTLIMMKLNAYPQEQIQKNLESDSPIPFIDDNIMTDEIPPYKDFNSVNAKWTPWVKAQKEYFDEQLEDE